MFNSPIVGMDDVDITYLIIRYDLEEEPIAATPEEIHVTCGDIQLPPIRSINVQHPEPTSPFWTQAKNVPAIG
jgi:hypothetical protein